LDKLNAEVDLLKDDENALADEQRAKRISALQDQMLLAERVEEALICLSDVAIVRRLDADPRAVLGLSSDLHRGDQCKNLSRMSAVACVLPAVGMPRARPERATFHSSVDHLCVTSWAHALGASTTMIVLEG